MTASHAWRVATIASGLGIMTPAATAGCANPTTFARVAGCPDGLDLTSFSEPSAPSPALRSFDAGCEGVLPSGFDDALVDRCFKHTIQGGWPSCGAADRGAGCGTIVGATLEIALRANDAGSVDDTIALFDGGTPIWGGVDGLIATLAGRTWAAGAMTTLVVDLDDLPASGGATSILQSLLDGELGVLVRDDTSVDWMKLTVIHCAGEERGVVILEFDQPNDGFASPTATLPAPALVAQATCFAGPLTLYDELAFNECFVETLSGWPSCTTDIHLTIGVRPYPGVNWFNDTLWLEFDDGCGGGFAWSSSLAALQAMGYASSPFIEGQTTAIAFSLSDTALFGSTNMVAAALDGAIDVQVRDDTGVDFIRLVCDTGASCPVDPIEPAGACCYFDATLGVGLCAQTDSAACEALAGTWYGSFSACDDVQCVQPCVAPSAGLTSWWTMDDLDAEAVTDSWIASADGTAAPGAAPIAGKIGLARAFDGRGGGVEVPFSALHEPGLGPLSVAAWVRPGRRQENTRGAPETSGTIVQRWGVETAAGWSIQIDAGGHPVLLLAGPCGSCAVVGATPLPAEAWTHVAFTLSGCARRPCGDPGSTRLATLYVDGKAVAGHAVNCCDLATDAMLTIGGSGPGASTGGAFHGAIDEVQLVLAELSPAGVSALAAADQAGTCGDTTYAAATAAWCPECPPPVTSFTVCNDSATACTYTWSIASSTDGACGDAELGFVPAAGAFSLEPGACATRQTSVIVANTPGPGPLACPTVVIVNQTTGELSSATGSVVALAMPVSIAPSDPVIFVFGDQPKTIGFEVSNLAEAPVKAAYRIEVRPVNGGGPETIFQLGDLSAGTPVDGVLALAGGGTAMVSTIIGSPTGADFAFHDVVFMVDVDGDGDLESAASIGARWQPPSPCATDLNNDGSIDGADLGLLLGDWGGRTFDIDGDGEVDGADLGLVLGAWGEC